MKPLFWLSLLLLTSCVGKMMSKSIQDDGVQIPPEFGSTVDTLLAVKQGRNTYDNQLRKRFAAAYRGPYKLVTNEELGTRYQDVERYRYVFNVEERTGDMSSTSVVYRFFVWDRKAQKQYMTKRSSGMYGKFMEIYLGKLDDKRKGGK